MTIKVKALKILRTTAIIMDASGHFRNLKDNHYNTYCQDHRPTFSEWTSTSGYICRFVQQETRHQNAKRPMPELEALLLVRVFGL